MTPKFIKLDDKATIPTRATKSSAGYDLTSMESVTILPGMRRLIRTGIGWTDMPSCAVGNIKPRSGLAVKYGIATMAGVIDADYDGEIRVLLANHGSGDFYISSGNRIAQLVVSQYFTVDEDTVSEERTGGYGSTGV